MYFTIIFKIKNFLNVNLVNFSEDLQRFQGRFTYVNAVF